MYSVIALAGRAAAAKINCMWLSDLFAYSILFYSIFYFSFQRCARSVGGFLAYVQRGETNVDGRVSDE